MLTWLGQQEEGIRTVDPEMRVAIIQYLTNLCLRPSPAAMEGAFVFVAVPFSEECQERAIDTLRAADPGTTILVNVNTAGPSQVDVVLTSSEAALQRELAAGTPYAVLDVSPLKKKKTKQERDEAFATAAGAIVGAGTGFAIFGGLGVILGGIGGAMVGRWIA